MQFKAIEQNLNKLCSQHDEYMSLLDIVDYLNNIKTLTQNNRNLNNKIILLEQSIKDIQEIRFQQNTQQRQQNHSKLQKFKKNIVQIQQKLENYNSILMNFDINIKNIQNDSHHFAYYKDINDVNTNILQIIEKETTIVQTYVANYKNQLESKVIETVNFTKEICEQTSKQENINENLENQLTLKSITENTLKDQLEEYDKLAHQISVFKLQFPIPQLKPFVQHNYQAIKQEISALLSIMSMHEQKISSTDFNVLKQEYLTLFYRTKALKNYVLSQLLQLYDNSKSISVNKLQKEVGGMIRELENRLQLLNGFIQKIQYQRNFIQNR